MMPQAIGPLAYTSAIIFSRPLTEPKKAWLGYFSKDEKTVGLIQTFKA